MARISLSICDFCKNTTTSELDHKLELSSKDGPSHEAEICNMCHLKILKQLKQEAQPVIPKAANSTPSDSEESPVLLDEFAGEPTSELLDSEVKYVKSNFTDERKRQVMADMASKCSHEKGFTMAEDGAGITCKLCGERAQF